MVQILKNEKRYIVPMFVPGVGEFAAMHETNMNEHPELGRFFREDDVFFLLRE